MFSLRWLTINSHCVLIRNEKINLCGIIYCDKLCGVYILYFWFFQYKQNPEMFKQTARLWSHVYAGAPVSSPEYTRKIDKLCAMGFDKVSTLVTTDGILQLSLMCISICKSLPLFF